MQSKGARERIALLANLSLLGFTYGGRINQGVLKQRAWDQRFGIHAATSEANPLELSLSRSAG
jgi:hypothetical protein